MIGIVSAKLDAAVALAASGVPQGGMNYAVKSSLLFELESVPDARSNSNHRTWRMKSLRMWLNLPKTPPPSSFWFIELAAARPGRAPPF